MAEWKGKTRGGSTGYAIFIFLIRHLGVGAAYALLHLVAPYFVPFAPKATVASYRYWRMIHHKGRVMALLSVFRHYYRFGQVIIDKIATSAGLEDQYSFESDGIEAIEEQLRAGLGAVMIGAHFGNWEVSRCFMKDFGRKLNVVMLDAEYQKVKDKLDEAMGERTFGVIPVSSDSMDHVFMIKSALDRGEMVCFQGDRYMDGSKHTELEFMGAKAEFPLGPSEIAARTGVPVFYFFTIRSASRHYTLFARRSSDFSHLSPRSRSSAILDEYKQILEEKVYAYPEQWFNFYRFWK